MIPTAARRSSSRASDCTTSASGQGVVRISTRRRSSCENLARLLFVARRREIGRLDTTTCCLKTPTVSVSKSATFRAPECLRRVLSSIQAPITNDRAACDLWDLLGETDERLDLAGGGLLKLDTFRRAMVLPGNEIVILLGEGTSCR